MTDTRQARSAGAADSRARPSDAFTVADLVHVVERRGGLILQCALVVVGLTAAAVFLFLPTLFSSAAEITIDTQKNNVADQAAVLSALPTDTPTLQNQIQVLTSRDLATEVIAKLKLYDDPEFNTRLDADAVSTFNPRNWFKAPQAYDPGREVDSIIAAFSRHLTVEALGLSTSISVGFSSRDPDKAALIANTVADTYVADQLAAKRAVTAGTAAWLTDRIAVLGQQSQAAEAAAEQFKTANHLSETADGTPLVDEQISQISAQLEQARTDLAQKQAMNAQVAALAASGNTAQLSQVVSSPLIIQLRTQQALAISDEAQLMTKYGPRHPKLIAAQTQKRDLEDKIAAEVQRIASSVGNDVAVSKTSVASLSGSLAQAERQAQAQNLLRVKLQALEANAISTRATYDNFVTRLRETQGQEGIITPDAHVISHAAMPLAPNGPSKTLLVGASIPAGLLIGLIIALFAERMAPAPVRGAPMMQPVPAMARVAAAFSPPLLAEIPNASDRNAANLIVDWPHSAFAYAVAQLLDRVAPVARGSRTLVVASLGQGRENPSVAVALTRAAALSRRQAILIDGDLRRPMAAFASGLPPAEAGLIDVLSGRVPLTQAVQVDPRTNAMFLSAAKPVWDAQSIFSTPIFAEMLSYLKRNCGLVVIHAPARDAMALTAYADAVLLVVDRRLALADETLRAVEDFAPAGNRVGVVLAG